MSRSNENGGESADAIRRAQLDRENAKWAASFRRAELLLARSVVGLTNGVSVDGLPADELDDICERLRAAFRDHMARLRAADDQLFAAERDSSAPRDESQ